MAGGSICVDARAAATSDAATRRPPGMRVITQPIWAIRSPERVLGQPWVRAREVSAERSLGVLGHVHTTRGVTELGQEPIGARRRIDRKDAVGIERTPARGGAMNEKSLYERLGGVFAIAAVDHFSDATVANSIVGQASKNPALREWHTQRLGRLPGLKFMRTLWAATSLVERSNTQPRSQDRAPSAWKKLIASFGSRPTSSRRSRPNSDDRWVSSRCPGRRRPRSWLRSRHTRTR